MTISKSNQSRRGLICAVLITVLAVITSFSFAADYAYAADYPVYPNNPAGYKYKDVFSTETAEFEGIDVYFQDSYGERQPMDGLEFVLFNTTTQEIEDRFTCENGKLPKLTLKQNHNYMIWSSDDNYTMRKPRYFWVHGNRLEDIKTGYNSSTGKFGAYSEFKEIRMYKPSMYQDKQNRYYTTIPVVMKGSTSAAVYNLDFKLVSMFDTVEASTGNKGEINAELIEDVAYTVQVDSDKYDVQAFPLVVKDKSEYGDIRYTYNHTTCHCVGRNPVYTPLEVVPKGQGHAEDGELTSISGDTTIGGFKWNDLIIVDKKLDTKIDALEGKDYEIIGIKAVNPHRYEVTRLCTGEYTYKERIRSGEEVEEAYLVNDKGELSELDFTQNGNIIEFTTDTVSMYSLAIVYKHTEPLEKFIRIAGNTRFETAVEVADRYLEMSGKSSFDNVIVACGTNFPDALAGGYLAKVKNAPILLVSSATETKIADYIDSKLSEDGKIYLLGGKSAVSEKFQNKMETVRGSENVIRLGGATRYDTNIAILGECGTDFEDLLVCTATSYADSLSASASGRPILLVSGGSLTASQKSYLDSVAGKNIIVLGGKAAVGDAMLKSLGKYDGDAKVERVAGASRYDTSAAIAERFCPETDTVVLTVGNNFPDGLSGSLLANYLNAPILLVNSGKTDAAVKYFDSKGAGRVIVLGGEKLITDKDVQKFIK